MWASHRSRPLRRDGVKAGRGPGQGPGLLV